jgi:hypothetical protein
MRKARQFVGIPIKQGSLNIGVDCEEKLASEIKPPFFGEFPSPAAKQ